MCYFYFYLDLMFGSIFVDNVLLLILGHILDKVFLKSKKNMCIVSVSSTPHIPIIINKKSIFIMHIIFYYAWVTFHFLSLRSIFDADRNDFKKYLDAY